MAADRSAYQPLELAAESDVGRLRAMNQDSVFAGPVPGAAAWQILAVADGLGGHPRGEWASQRAVEVAIEALGRLLDGSDPTAALGEAIRNANLTVHSEAPGLGAPGAATTLVVALYRDGEVWWANVGDSRLYHFSGEGLRQLTSDHSWVAEQVRAGILTADAARNHSHRNVVTRTVGFEPEVSADTGGPLVLEPGEDLLLCSDGLYGPVEEAEIARTLATLDPGPAARRLVELANEAGGPDNITVVIGRRPPANLRG
jgi:protein phosphatase